MHSEDEKAKKDGYTHQRDGSWSCKKLPVIETEVPDHGKQHYKNWHHQTAHTECKSSRAKAGADASGNARLGLLTVVWTGPGQALSLADVAVQDAVVGDVE